jgi:hypothetical protein
MPVDVTAKYIWVRVRLGKFDKFRIITISKSKGIIARLGINKGEKSKTQAYGFLRSKWTKAEAIKWVKGHGRQVATLSPGGRKMIDNAEREFLDFDIADASVVEDSIEFAGKTYKPTLTLGYVSCTMFSTFPNINKKGRAITAATTANSFESAQWNLVDLEHWLTAHSKHIQQDRILGFIMGVEFPEKAKAVAKAAKGEKVPLKGLLCLYKKAKGVPEILAQIKEDSTEWKTSFEFLRDPDDDAFWHDGKFIARKDAPEEMQACVTSDCVEDYKGVPLVLILAGEDGEGYFTGHALTRTPADPTATLHSFVASTNGDGQLFPLCWESEAASMKEEIEKSDNEDTAGGPFVIGYTGEADEHTHPILQNLEILGTKDHNHMSRIIDVDLQEGTIRGTTTLEYVGEGKSHQHVIALRVGESGESLWRNSNTPDSLLSQEAVMNKEKQKKRLADALNAVVSVIGDEHTDVANQLKKAAEGILAESAEEGLAEAIAARVKDGEFIEKADHEKALAESTEKAEKEVRDEYQEKEKAETHRLEVVASRTVALKEAGFDSEAVLYVKGEDKDEVTYASHIAAEFTADEDGEGHFRAWLASIESVRNTMKNDTKDKDTTKLAGEKASLNSDAIFPVLVPTGTEVGSKDKGAIPLRALA